MLVQKAKINPPRINSDTVKAAFLFCFDNTLFYLEKLSQCVPVHGLAYDNGIIGKTVYFFHMYLPVLQGPKDCTSAGRPEVKCKNLLLFTAHTHSSFQRSLTVTVSTSLDCYHEPVISYILTLSMTRYLCYNGKKYNNIHIKEYHAVYQLP